jgi:capsular polysaccharide transport system permease protein
VADNVALPPSPAFPEFQVRPALKVTLAVWKALFLREALYRLLSSRSAPLWLFFEPVLHVSYLLLIYTVIRIRVIGGIDTTLWLLCGILTFVLFRRTFTQTTKAVDANTSLFTYRQVKPIDTLLVRAALEFLVLFLVGAILFSGAALFGHDVRPANPLQVMGALIGIWVFALAWGMVASVAENLVPELGNLNRMITAPLYILSGTIAPLSRFPYPYLDWLMLNPIAHALELVRQGFSPYYHVAPGTSMTYLWAWAVGLLFLGLCLQRRFALRLTTQ